MASALVLHSPLPSSRKRLKPILQMASKNMNRMMFTSLILLSSSLLAMKYLSTSDAVKCLLSIKPHREANEVKPNYDIFGHAVSAHSSMNIALIKKKFSLRISLTNLCYAKFLSSKLSSFHKSKSCSRH